MPLTLKKNIGLFFGSFNPIHVGHLIIANHFANHTDLDEVWLIVTPHNPLKDKKSLLDNNHRLQLVKLAIGDNSKLKASDIEFKLEQPNYTVKTLAYLSEKYPACKFALIMGADNLQSIHKWMNYEQILKQYSIYVYPRPGIDISNYTTQYKNVKIINDAPLMEISATTIRYNLRSKKDVSYLIPQPALEYIKEMHFYEK